MPESTEDNKFEKVVHKIDPQSKLLRTWELKGGISVRVTVLEIERPDGHTQKMVVRQHGYHLDQSGDIFSTPYLVIAYIEGKTEFAPSNVPDFILQLATQLYRIHHVDCSHLDVSFLPQQEKRYAEKLKERPTNVDESVDEGHIRDVLESVWPLPQRNPSVLLHGDFWPGNIVWKDTQLAAVIDWEDAALGDPLADVANGRREILWAFGIDAMRSFTHQYQALTTIDFTHLPYWDLCAALRTASQIAEWATDDLAKKAMREGHKWFIIQAFEKLSVQ